MESVIREWSTRPPSKEIAALGRAAGERHGGVAAVLFYGSCLRTGKVDDGIADLYLLVDDYRKAFGSRFKALMNRLLPPNVFYLEVPFEGKIVRAKYAVLTVDHFEDGVRRWFHSYLWGRFAQPSGVIHTRDAEMGARVIAGLARAVGTFVRRSLPLVPERFTARELWVAGLRWSYRCELRSEKPATAERLFDSAPDYYEAVTRCALDALAPAVETLSGGEPARFRSRVSSRMRLLNGLGWRLRQAQGKILSVLRLAKALFTFDHGLDYIFWKIERHSGVRVECGPVLRRFPPLAVCVTFWKLYRKGAFR